ncbi:MAG: hypothetical protein IJV83_04030 [Clostridia bacterium]|nr:hypothetical protein [Clostridia bacterium]
MEEVKKPQIDKTGRGVALIGFGMCIVFFVLFFLGLVKYYDKAYAANEMTEAFKDLKTQLEVLKDTLESVFKDKEGVGMAVSQTILGILFPIISVVWFYTFVIRVLFSWLPLMRASSEKITWAEAAEKMDKKVRNYVKEVLGYIVCAYMMCGTDVIKLSTFGVLFVIVAIVYYVGRRAWEDKGMLQDDQKLKYLLNLVYDVLKAVSLFLVVLYLVKQPLMIYVVGYLFDVLLGFLQKRETMDIVKFCVMPLVGMILGYIVVGRTTTAIEKHVQSKEESAKASTKGALVFSIIATIFTAVYFMFILPKDEGRMKFGEWFKSDIGKYFVMSLLFIAIACAVFLFEKLIALIVAKSSTVPVVEAEAAVSDNAAESAVETEEVVAEDDDEE